MSGRVLHFESPAHREADALLPWYVNGTLTEGERETVEAHIVECPRCARELNWLRDVQTQSAEPGATLDAEASLRRLRERINAGRGRRALARLRSLRETWARAPAWTRRALAAQCALCIVLAGALAYTGRIAAPYHTLGANPAVELAGARLVVVFDPSLSENRIRSLVRASDAQIVDGPTDAGAYVLAVPRARAARALAALKKDSGVRMAAALDPGKR